MLLVMSKKLFDKAKELFEVDCVDIFVNNAGVNTSVGWKKMHGSQQNGGFKRC